MIDAYLGGLDDGERGDDVGAALAPRRVPVEELEEEELTQGRGGVAHAEAAGLLDTRLVLPALPTGEDGEGVRREAKGYG